MEEEVVNKGFDKMKVVHVIRRLNRCQIFHDCVDIEADPLEEILPQYEIYISLNDEESDVVKDELKRLATREEVREAFRWAMWDIEPAKEVKNRRMPSAEMCEKEHKRWAAERRRERGETVEEEIKRRAEYLLSVIHCEVI